MCFCFQESGDFSWNCACALESVYRQLQMRLEVAWPQNYSFCCDSSFQFGLVWVGLAQPCITFFFVYTQLLGSVNLMYWTYCSWPSFLRPFRASSWDSQCYDIVFWLGVVFVTINFHFLSVSDYCTQNGWGWDFATCFRFWPAASCDHCCSTWHYGSWQLTFGLPRLQIGTFVRSVHSGLLCSSRLGF